MKKDEKRRKKKKKDEKRRKKNQSSVVLGRLKSTVDLVDWNVFCRGLDADAMTDFTLAENSWSTSTQHVAARRVVCL